MIIFDLIMNEKEKHMQRNYSIDFVRVLSMFMVFLIHNLGQGGVLQHNVTGPTFYFGWLLENFGIIAVNLFAMITGYLLVDRDFKFKRIWNVFIQASFWGPLMVLIAYVMGEQIGLKSILQGLLPIVMNEYWYVNAYLGVILFSPFINLGLHRMDKSRATFILGTAVTFASTIGFLGNWFLSDGYSSMWLIIMYASGAYVKMYIRPITSKMAGLLIAISISMAFISLICEYVAVRVGISPYLFISYVSPFVIIQSLLMFVVCINFQVCQAIGNVLNKLGNLTFGAYLINDSYFYVLLKDKLTWVINLNPFVMVGVVLLITIVMFMVMLSMEYIRQKAFDKFGISKLVDLAYNKLEQMFVSGSRGLE